MNESKKAGAAKAGATVVSILLWIVILIAALYSITVLVNKDGKNVSSVAGFTPLVVESDSMVPAFRQGDMVIIRKCDTGTLKVGDVITFHTVINNELALNTHRIAGINDEGNGYRSYVTKGDNNIAEDDHLITDGNIVGKQVGTLPGVGRFMNFLSSNLGFLTVIAIPMLLFMAYQLYHLISVIIELKKASTLEAIEEQARKLIEAERALAAAKAEKAKEEDNRQ